MLGHDVGLMIRAFAAALEDDNILVRRNGLDLILQALRLGGVAIQRASNVFKALKALIESGTASGEDVSIFYL